MVVVSYNGIELHILSTIALDDVRETEIVHVLDSFSA